MKPRISGLGQWLHMNKALLSNLLALTGLPFWTILDRTSSAQQFHVFVYIFLFVIFVFVSCGRLSWLNYQLITCDEY